MSKLPIEGIVGTNMDDMHCIAAAQHAFEAGPDFAPTDAEAGRIARGEMLLNGVPESVRDLV